MLKKVKDFIDKVKAKIKTCVSFPLQREVMALVCRWRGHKYIDGYFTSGEQRSWKQGSHKKGKHLYKEFRYECARCKEWGEWKKWRYKEAFDEQHGLI